MLQISLNRCHSVKWKIMNARGVYTSDAHNEEILKYPSIQPCIANPKGPSHCVPTCS